MDDIINDFKNFDIISKKKCICCQRDYVIENDYKHSDLLCIICNENYLSFMFEDNSDYVEII